MERTPEQIAEISRGAYVLRDCDGTPDAIIVATGSEVELAVNAAEILGDQKEILQLDTDISVDIQGFKEHGEAFVWG